MNSSFNAAYEDDFEDFQDEDANPISLQVKIPVSICAQIQKTFSLHRYSRLEKSPTLALMEIFPISNSVHTQVPDPFDKVDSQVETSQNYEVKYEDKYTPSVDSLHAKQVDVLRLSSFVRDAGLMLDRLLHEEEQIEDGINSGVDFSVVGFSERFQVLEKTKLESICFNDTFICTCSTTGLINVYSRGNSSFIRQFSIDTFATCMTIFKQFLFCGVDGGTLLIYDLKATFNYPSYSKTFVTDANYDTKSILKIVVLASYFDDKIDVFTLDDSSRLISWRLSLNWSTVIEQNHDFGCAYGVNWKLSKRDIISTNMESFCLVQDRFIATTRDKDVVGIDKYGKATNPSTYQPIFTPFYKKCSPCLITSYEKHFVVSFHEGLLALFEKDAVEAKHVFSLTDNLIGVTLSDSKIFLAYPTKLSIRKFADFSSHEDEDELSVGIWNETGDEASNSTFKNIHFTTSLFSPSKKHLIICIRHDDETRIELHSI